MTGMPPRGFDPTRMPLAFDPLGRLWQTVSGAYGTTQFVYEGDHVAVEYDGAGTMLRRYMWGSGADEPILQDEGGALNCSGTRFLHADHQGSIIATANCAGNRQNVNSYDEYGIPASTNWGRFQYTGQAWIPDLGIYYYKARMYSPTLGRFLQTDPIGYDDQVNLYAYVANDPVNGTDPSGLAVEVQQSECQRGSSTCAGWSGEMPESNGRTFTPRTVVPPGFRTGGGAAISEDKPQSTHEFTVPDDGSGDIIVTAHNQISDSTKYVRAGGRYYLNPHYVDPHPWLNLQNAILAGPVGAAAIYSGLGREFLIRGMRFAPLGNRTRNWIGQLPHYHRRVTGPDGTTLPGQGIKHHRPWQGGF